MKKLQDLIDERRQILNADRRFGSPKEDREAEARVTFLTTCINYLNTEPTAELLARELSMIETKIEAIERRLPEYSRGRQGGAEYLKKQWYKQNNMSHLQAQRKTLKFLTEDSTGC